MASSKNEKYEDAADEYEEAKKTYSGTEGYNRAYEDSQENSKKQAEENYNAGIRRGYAITDEANLQGTIGARTQTKKSTESALEYGNQMNASQTDTALSQGAKMNSAQNAEAQRYANQQAQSAAAGAQSQATTAARAAGMNKAQAAMLGSQQNANTYQNTYGNAYSQQLGNAASNQNTQLNNAAGNQSLQLSNYNNTFENRANRANTNINTQQGANSATQQYQQGAATNAGNTYIGASGTQLSAGQQEGQAEYDRTWGNWGNGLGIGGSVLKSFSDEDLKHYRECSKKVTIRSPKSIQKLKFVQKEN